MPEKCCLLTPAPLWERERETFVSSSPSRMYLEAFIGWENYCHSSVHRTLDPLEPLLSVMPELQWAKNSPFYFQGE